MSLLEKEAKNQAEEIHDKKRDISFVFKRKDEEETSSLLAIES
jgi:hypothetical protein